MQLQGESAENVEALMAGRLQDADLSEADRALLAYCGQVNEAAFKTSREDTDQLRGLGWSDPQIAEAVLVASMFAMFNRVADAFGLSDPGYQSLKPSDQPVPATEFKKSAEDLD